jgi:hypothetical protein
LYVKNSTIGVIGPTETSSIEIENSSIDGLELSFVPGTVVDVYDLRAGFFEYLDLKDKVSSSFHVFNFKINKTSIATLYLGVWYDSRTLISSSEFDSFGIIIPSNISARIDSIRPGFFEYENLGQTIVKKSRLAAIFVHMEFSENSVVTVVNSTVGLFPGHRSTLYVKDSLVDGINTHGWWSFLGSLCFENTTWRGGILVYDSNLYITGNVTFVFPNFDITWHSSIITRNYEVVLKDAHRRFVSDTTLTLKSEDGAVIWNGVTDSLGTAFFNMTYTDSNYTDTSRLESFDGNYSGMLDVGLLSDTPLVLIMKYFADLNGDGTINIVDVSIVAKAFNSRQGDVNWNKIADLDKNGQVNILDIALVAKDYGKTV